MGTCLYPSDLTDAEWHYIEPLLPTPKATGRPRKWDLRLVMNALFYLIRSGCPWRMLPREFPPWPTVHDFYRRLRLDGTWEQIHTQIRQMVRKAAGRKETPSGAVLDSQSIKTTDKGGPARGNTIGFDGHKRVKGRKRHLLVDTQGLVLKVHNTGANQAERTGARHMLAPLASQFPRLRIVWADQGYSGLLEAWVQEKLGWHLEIVKRVTPGALREQAWATARERQKQGASVVEMWAGSKMSRGVDILPRRWVVERTFAWLTKCRRLAKDYEFLPQSGETMIYLRMIQLMIKRLSKTKPKMPA